MTVESGLNDGMIVPAVAIFLALSLGEAETNSASFWVRFVSEQIGLGLLVGCLIGGVGAVLLNVGQRHNWVNGEYAKLGTFAIAIGALTGALAIGGNGFIAAFVGGLVFGTIVDDGEELGLFTEAAAQLAAALSFFVFGNVLLGPALGQASVTLIACAVAVLTVGRMVPVAVAMAGSGASGKTMAFIGWFGPRGLASILFGLLLLKNDFAVEDQLFGVVAWTVLFSVVLHGATAAVGARRYGTWWSGVSPEDRATMPEGVNMGKQRQRTM